MRAQCGVVLVNGNLVAESILGDVTGSWYPDTQRWSVGVEAFRIGCEFLRRTKVSDAGRPIMRELMESCGETVNLAIADKGNVVFITQVETHEPIRAFFRPWSLVR